MDPSGINDKRRKKETHIVNKYVEHGQIKTDAYHDTY